MKRLTYILLSLCLITPLWGTEQRTFHTQLMDDYHAGRISRTLFFAYQLMAAENPEKLPQAYRSYPVRHDRCPTLVSAQARALLDSISGPEKTFLASLLSRPSVERLPITVKSPKGYFALHYTNSGPDSSSEEFIREAARTFDQVYDLLVYDMGYNPPPNDLEAGDTPELDIYIMQFHLYGQTNFEQSVPGSAGERYTSYILIDNNFSSGFQTRSIDALHVTAAHEFFHMIQGGGYRFFPATQMDSRFLFEASSVWFEEYAFASVNDYLQYADEILKSPDQPFHQYSSTTYGLGLYMIMLEKRHHRDVIRHIWEGLYDQEPLPALNQALAFEGEQIGASLAHFAVWNGFTDVHADTIDFYPEGHLYPLIKEREAFTYSASMVIEGEASELVTHHYRIRVPMGGTLQITPSFNRPADWIYGVIIYDSLKSDSYHITAGNGNQILSSLSPGSELLLATTNISLPVSNYSRTMQSYTFLISTSHNSTLQEEGIISMAPAPFRPGESHAVQIQFRLPKVEKSLALFILSEHGRVIYKQNFENLPDGLNCFFWDGKDMNGQMVPSGVYLCYLRGSKTWPPRKIALIR